jgi:hypothetical protein
MNGHNRPLIKPKRRLVSREINYSNYSIFISYHSQQLRKQAFIVQIVIRVQQHYGVEMDMVKAFVMHVDCISNSIRYG